MSAEVNRYVKPDLEALAGQTMRVASLNVWGTFGDWKSRLRLLQELWGSLNPDVLLAQEVIVEAGTDQLGDLAEALDYGHAEWIEGHAGPGGREGLAILSRTRLADVRAQDLPASVPRRRMLLADVAWADTKVTLVNVHTVVNPPDVRRAQIEAALDRPEADVIVGGDLNVTPEEIEDLLEQRTLVDSLAGQALPTWPVCRATFIDAWEARLGHAPIFPLEPRRIDYLISRGVRVASSGVQVLGSAAVGYASDHAVVFCDYESATVAKHDGSRGARVPDEAGDPRAAEDVAEDVDVHLR